MRNVTITLPDDLARRARVEAAKADKSLSRFVSEIVESALGSKPRATSTENPQLEALERILSGPKWDVMEGGRMPTAEERNVRR